MSIEHLVKKYLNQVDFRIPCSVNGSGSGGGPSVKSNMTCHKSGKKGHIQKEYRSKETGSSGNPPKNSTMGFETGSLRSLLFHIPNILQHPP